MRKMFIFTLFWTLVMGLSLWAQSNPPASGGPVATKAAEPVAAMQAAGFKMGFIDLERALLQVDEGKKEFGDLEKFVRDKESEVKGKQDAIDNMRKQLSSQDKNLKDEMKAQMQRDIDSKMTELERFTQDTQREIDGKRTTAINKIGARMQPIIESVAKDQGYAAILVYSPNSPLYAYIDLGKYDVTNAVIERYNKTPVASSTAPAAPAAQPKAPNATKK